MTDYEATRQRHIAYLTARVPEHIERLTWSADRLRAERTARLRTLLAVARTASPWHRARLLEVDVDRFDEDRLRELPVMTKHDLMAHFDAIVTDRRVTLDLVNAHLAGLSSDAYLLDDLHAIASGGSSGVRGVFVWGWEGWAEMYLVAVRRMMQAQLNDPMPPSGPPVIMVVAAEKASHSTAAVSQTFNSPIPEVHRYPVTLPLETIVDGLNRVNGTVLVTYASMLAVLAAEAHAGRLTIRPRWITATADPLLPEIRAAARAAWGAPIANQWGTSEAGIVAIGCFRNDGMHLSDDLVIVEAVDEHGAPVPCGTESGKVYLTNLSNPVLPLIRYEITDRITLLEGACACGSTHRRIADISGRLDDSFTYRDGVVVHPHVLRSVLGGEADVVEYQVRQTAGGAEVLLRVGGPVDTQRLEGALEAALRRSGCPQPRVTARIVEELPRIGVGKLKRFVPLAAPSG